MSLELAGLLRYEAVLWANVKKSCCCRIRRCIVNGECLWEYVFYCRVSALSCPDAVTFSVAVIMVVYTNGGGSVLRKLRTV